MSEKQVNEVAKVNDTIMQNNSEEFNLRNLIMADNESTINLFCNRKLLKGRRTWKTKKYKNVETNAGVIQVSEQGYVEGFGPVWFSEEAITNIFCFADIADKLHITYDNWISDFFTVKCQKNSNVQANK